MTPDALWDRYSAVWSLPAETREAELTACLSEEAAYCDPNGLLTGVAALCDYMGRFQGSVPGGPFNIRSVLHHHDRSLAHWALHGADGQVLQTGTSFGLIAGDGRFQAISGFFHPRAQAPET